MKRFLPSDARVLQILFLGSLLGLGALLRDFSIRPEQVLLTFATALATQALVNRALGAHDAGLRSAVVTALGLSLLLRANALWIHPAAALIAIAAKAVFRVRGKHLFNPANLGVMVALLAFPGAWVSPGQWGHEVALAGWIFVLGAAVVSRAARSDTSFAFLAFYLGAIALRVAWLGQRPAVLLHQLENGALLLFAFFMISDPRTTPNHRAARVLHAAAVAALAYAWQFSLYRTNGLLWALFLCAPLVPLLDRIVPAPAYRWTPQGGSDHGSLVSPPSLPRRARARRALARGAA